MQWDKAGKISYIRDMLLRSGNDGRSLVWFCLSFSDYASYLSSSSSAKTALLPCEPTHGGLSDLTGGVVAGANIIVRRGGCLVGGGGS